MKTRSQIAVLLVAVIALVTGCAGANFQARPGYYEIAGYSRNPEAMAQTVSENYSREVTSSAYADCMRAGRCYGYPSGTYRTDYGQWFGGLTPPQPQYVVPGSPAQPSPAASGAVVDEQARREAQEARKRADDALRLYKLEHPSGTK